MRSLVENNSHEFQLLLQDIDIKDTNLGLLDKEGDFNVLDVAARYDRFIAIKYILGYKLKDELAANNEYNILHTAVKYGQVGAIEYITKKTNKYTESLTKHGCNILHISAVCGQLEAMQYIINNVESIKIDSKDYEGYNILHLAVEYCKFDIIKYIIDNIGREYINLEDTTQNGQDIFYLATVKRSNSDTLEYIIKLLGEEALVKNCFDIIHSAYSNKKSDVIKYIIDNNIIKKFIDKNLVDKDYSMKGIVLKYTCLLIDYTVLRGNLDLSKYLIDDLAKYVGNKLEVQNINADIINSNIKVDRLHVIKFMCDNYSNLT